MRAYLVAILWLACSGAAFGQFDLEESHTTASLRGIDAVGSGVAWASGSNGTVLRTEDGGYLWQTCTVPPGGEALDFRAVQGFDAQTALVMSSGKGTLSRVYKTTDGCQTWTLVLTNDAPEGFWDTLKMWNRGSGFLVGDAVDGKMTILESVNNPTDDQWLNYDYLAEFSGIRGPGESAFAASNSCVALGPFHTADGAVNIMWFATGGSAGSRVRILSGRIGGEPGTFTTSIVEVAGFPRTQSGGIFSIFFRGEKVGVVVGGDYLQANASAGTAAWSVDGGKSWTPAKALPHGYRSAVAYSVSARAWLTVGTNGADASFDDGRTWRAIVGDNAAGWNAISLPFVVGGKGRIGRVQAGALTHVVAKPPTK